MKSFKNINNIGGWFCFLFAAVVYTLTLEPTASFWDCGEFIACTYKLQIGHPPGAPLFLMLGRIFMLFAGSNLKHLSVMVNFLSGLMSAGAVMFLFWSITHFTKKIVAPKGELTVSNIIVIMGSGLIGAIAFAFTDSFWFSAVEGEVYASSAFFTSITFWAMLKWESVADEPKADRWLIFIGYLFGLSIGVHLLNLLAIPAVAMVYYYKRFKYTNKGFTIAIITGFALLGFVVMGFIPGLVSTAAKFDLFFVNDMGLGFGSGLLTYAILVIGVISFGLYYTQQENKPKWVTILLCVPFILFTVSSLGFHFGSGLLVDIIAIAIVSYFVQNAKPKSTTIWNTALLFLSFMIIGYTSFAQIVIRSLANTPMDENNPENVFTLLSYLNRDQYGERPIAYGPLYNAKPTGQEEGDMTYYKGKTDYVEAGRKVSYTYDTKDKMLFPRMYSTQAEHINQYKYWTGLKGDEKPTFIDNIKFYVKYQLGFMYFRYFMWNFSGRQNDLQGRGDFLEGNWITGIRFIDSFFLGPQKNLPQSMLNNRGRNKFYALPMILGLIGLFYHYRKHHQDANVVMMFFLFTGIMTVTYLNQPPLEPRERDYSYCGSFYAYCIWMGLGVAYLSELLRKKLPASASALTATALCSVVPFVMGKEGWNDHDRSGTFTSRDFAYDYLNSCAPNAILFTNGDNDTFPLWYIQEVEGVRTDVRVCNLSLLNTDWYIDQLKRKAYDSDALPFSLTEEKYVQGTRDYVPYYENKAIENKGYTNVLDIIDFIASDEPQAKLRTQGGGEINYYPTKKFRIPVDSATVVNNGTVPLEFAGQIVPAIEWDINKNYLMKNDIMIIDMLAHNNWKRPIYFAITVSNENYLNLEPYFQLEGLAYRLVPVKNKANNEGQTGRTETNIMYNNVMNKFQWGRMSDPHVYLNENNLRMTMNFRNNFSRLSNALLEEGKIDSAVKVLDRCIEVMPDTNVPYNVFMLRIAELYYQAGAMKNTRDNKDPYSPNDMFVKGNNITKRLADIYENDLGYYLSLKGAYAKQVQRESQQGVAVLQELLRMAKQSKQDALVKELEARMKNVEKNFQASGAGMQQQME